MNNKPGVSRQPLKAIKPISTKYSKGGGFEFWFDSDYLARRGILGKVHPLYNTLINGREETTEKE